jgi:hypothetical protein
MKFEFIFLQNIDKYYNLVNLNNKFTIWKISLKIVLVINLKPKFTIYSNYQSIC